jgi:sulfatase modifying factor 1
MRSRPASVTLWWLGSLTALLAGACATVEPAPAGYVHIPAGTYVLGEGQNLQNPRRKVEMAAFDIGVHEVTNREWAAFVAATGHVTLAEKRHDAMVFFPGLDEFRWAHDSTACWRFPNGISRGGIEAKMDHPVTCVSYLDIQAYCEWAHVRLPTLDEWEVAARGGSRGRFFWGNDEARIGLYANVWHGRDHLVADTADAWMYTSPVGSLKPNAYGLHDIYGNVFEFCDSLPDYLEERRHLASARGGSWWCSRQSCDFFNSVDIGRVRTYASFSNQGFRVVALGAASGE